MRLASILKELGLILLPVTVAGILLGFACLREARSQADNRIKCEASSGRYIQHGDKYWSGLCVKRDGLIWERLP